jgi:hypothetical protein
MPDVTRTALRFNCGGIDLVSPIDRMPEGSFPYLFNTRVLVEGRLDGRPGYTQFAVMQDPPNSVRRLNDPSKVYAPNGYIFVGGGGTKLYAGIETAYASIDTGYSGNPLSLIPFRPEQSPESWMYVYDANKQVKVRPDGQIRAQGVAPPTSAPYAQYGNPAEATIEDGQVVGGWTANGIDTSPTQTDRTLASAPFIVDIIYLDTSINTGWCCISPSSTPASWQGNRMRVILNTGGGNQETVVVRDVLPAITNCLIESIIYDSGTSGPCSIVFGGSPTGLARNSLVSIDSEVIRIEEVILSPDGTVYSVRCTPSNPHVAGSNVTGLVSWFVSTGQTHVGGETITSQYIAVTHAATGVGGMNLTLNVDASRASGRPVDPANDYMHISLYLANPSVITNVQLLLTLDSTPNFSFTNPGNSFIWTLTPAELISFPVSGIPQEDGAGWVEIVIPIASGVRSGNAPLLGLANITGMAIQLTTTDACNWGFDWWYLFGTYGPTVLPNAPVGYTYQQRFRDSSTGAHSVPGPQTRYEIFPLRESVIITPVTSSQVGVDSTDIYRFGGAIDTTPLYVGTTPNNPPNVYAYTDSLPDSSVLAADQAPDLGALQPWPLLVLPIVGICHTSGTSVVFDSGASVNLAMLNNTAILINGTAFLTYGQPTSTTTLQLTQSAGTQTGVVFQINSPTLAGQPLPFAFGTLEGPFAPLIWGLGDPLNGGLLYYTNFSDADSASDANTLELAPPSANLVSGTVWNGLTFAGNRDNLYCVRFSYLTTIGASNNTSFQWAKVATPSGIWSRWACCATPVGVVYLGRDGIYLATDTKGENISDAKLYSMFPHDGHPAEPINSGSNIIEPVDMTQLSFMRMSYCDEEVRFSYIDTGSNVNTIIWQIYKNRWFINNYHNQICGHYLVEDTEAGPNSQQIVMLPLDDDSLMLSGGNTDNGIAINSVVLTPSDDSKDERVQKLYVDTMTQADGTGTLQLAAAFNNAQSFSPVINIPCTGSIQQSLQNIASLADLSLYRNIGAKFAWTGGPDGPRLYAWETSGFLQPYLSQFFVTQFIPFSFPGWKHMRRMYPALISNSPVLMTIKTQDDRTYGPYTIPSTTGQYRILPQMLDQNIKDLAFALQLDGQGQNFAFFPADFTIEVKNWVEETYINLAVFKS